MQQESTRRTYLRRIGATATAVGLAAAPAVAADCDATVYTNASEGGEPKLEVPSGEAKVTGESTCDSGTELIVRARSSGGSSPFVMDRDPAVGDTGGWAATFDFSSHDPGTSFQLTVYHDDGDTLDSLENCEVVSDAATPHPTPSPTPTPSPSPTPEPTDTPTATRSPTATPDQQAGGTSTQADTTAESTDAPGEATATDGGGSGDAGDDTPTSTGAPGFGLAAAVAGLAAAAWRLRDDS